MPSENQQLIQEELQRVIDRYGLKDVLDVFDEIASTPGEHTRCSFCGRGPTEIDSLAAGRGVFICSHCIDQFHKIKQGTH